jgi:hypothetical protein
MIDGTRVRVMGAAWSGILLLGCGEPATVARDGAATADAFVADAAVEDVVSADADDASGDVADAAADASEAAVVTNPCAAEASVDLRQRGVREGPTTTYRGTTANAPPDVRWAPPADCLPAGTAIRTVAHRYVTGPTTTTLYVGAEGDGPAHDLALYVHRACTPAMPPQFCTTGNFYTSQAGSQVTSVPPNTTVWIAVSTIAKAAGAPGLPYRLQVTEAPVRLAGERCDGTTLARCAAGLTCARRAGYFEGTCAADGTAATTPCRASTPRCDDGLTCVNNVCMNTSPEGGPCVTGASSDRLCEGGLRCVALDPLARDGVCVAAGAPGSTCSSTVSCIEGATCSAPSNTGSCTRTVELGERCEHGLRYRCAAGLTCALHDATQRPPEYRCAAPGTVAGTPCADAEPRCATGLQCSAARGPGFCRAPATDACNPRLASDCGEGRVCARIGPITGRCVAWSLEGTADNDGVVTAEAPRRPPFAVRGALLPDGDRDCYGIELTETSRLVYQVQNGLGACVNDTALTTLTTPDRPRISVFVDGCVTTDTQNALVRPPGRYVLCVFSPTNSVGARDYVATFTAERVP